MILTLGSCGSKKQRIALPADFKGPKELYDIALGTLDFGEEEVYRTLGTFLRRFFSQQFKRNCAPEAPLVCLSIAPSVWNMPSDMASAAFMAEYERIKRRQS